MTLRTTALKKASSSFNASPIAFKRSIVTNTGGNGSQSSSPVAASGSGGRVKAASVANRSRFASTSESQKHKNKKIQDRDFLVSVLETSVTKRDTRVYINKFAPVLERRSAIGFKQPSSHSRDVAEGNRLNESKRASGDIATKVASKPKQLEVEFSDHGSLYVAIVKFRAPQEVGDSTLLGVGRTLGQLRKLGLISIVVVDCDIKGEYSTELLHTTIQQANRIAAAVDSYDEPGGRILDSPIYIGDTGSQKTLPFTSENLFIRRPNYLMSTLQEDVIPIIPSFAFTEDTCAIKPVDSNEAVLALTRQLSGLQPLDQQTGDSQASRLMRAAEVYRLIILDPVGGIPARNRATGRYMFLNLEQEFDEVTKHLAGVKSTEPSWKASNTENGYHVKNAELAKKTLALLPPTSSVLITTPHEAANEQEPDEGGLELYSVGTRRKQNPLIHNLLTDKPVQSSSLPSERFRPVVLSTGAPRLGSLTTLAKRGMPLTIFPDPQKSPWKPPQPGESLMKLTDPCVDLARLVNLIEDSFGRKLDVEHYLKRVEDKLAGIIIAGEYEGGAILTWENPLDGKQPLDSCRLVPYLDKFAVLRKSQGAGGVADIVFNAMVRDCFPDGVCWRSRKDNPVNKWYFERSRGSLEFKDTNWTMFWTTPGLSDQNFMDYQNVCRGIGPSWADKKQVLD